VIEIKITGIRKDNGNHANPFEAVEAYRWVQPGTSNGNTTERNVIVGWLDNGYNGEKVQAYVEQVLPRAYCYVNQSIHGTRFLQTRADEVRGNNLLSLPEC
jgi:hypothetical protein